jgi:hypothetical protein
VPPGSEECAVGTSLVDLCDNEDEVEDDAVYWVVCPPLKQFRQGCRKEAGFHKE